MRHDPVRESGGGSADEREAAVHALTLWVAVPVTVGGQDASVGFSSERAVGHHPGVCAVWVGCSRYADPAAREVPDVDAAPDRERVGSGQGAACRSRTRGLRTR
ncbi:hypothetical protein GCM10028802_36810 [Terrabacter terrigena]